VNDADEWREVEGIIQAQSKYVRKAWRVNLTVKYKATTAPVDASADIKNTKITIAVQAAF